MKKLIIVLAMAIVFMASAAWAGTDISFEWNANTEPDIASYKVYRSATSGTGYIEVGTVTHPTVEFTELNVPNGIWYWVCTALDEYDNESAYSNELTNNILDTTPPGAPGTFRFK